MIVAFADRSERRRGDAVSGRRVSAEILDGLAHDDPDARRSRRDLRRVHRFMGTRGIIVKCLGSSRIRSDRRLRVLELGAGDGTLMLGVARALRPRWPAVELTLLDRLDLIEPATVESYAQVGWAVKTQVADALQWSAQAASAAADTAQHWDLIVANLFLHHFDDTQLAALLAAVVRRCDRFFACEPRRGLLATVGSHLLGAIGASTVTRTDAVLSVQAGFRDAELQALWARDVEGWRLAEYSAGLFSHCLYAERSSEPAPSTDGGPHRATGI